MNARMTVVALAFAAGVGLAAAAAGEEAAGPKAGTVTFVAGEANRMTAKRAYRLAVGDAIFQGDVVETARRTRIELTLGDGSVLRLGPLSRVELDAAAFGKGPDDRKVSAKLRVGNVWANVTKAVGGEGRFEVKTDNAVAGVRGTTFRVDANFDRSVVVKVYAGAVAVAAGKLPRPSHAGGGKPERKQVAGPQEVTKQEWERLVSAMMEVRVAADGTPAEPEKFALSKGDEWERWNRDRDAAR